MESHASLLWSVLFGSIGSGYLIYGWKNRRATALVSGLLLCAGPYFIGDASLLVVVSVALMALPYYFRY